MKNIVIFLFSNLIFLFAQTPFTENTFRFDSSAANFSVELNEFSFLTGYWIGEAFGGKAEEIWSVPSDESIVGLFKLTENNKTIFTEFFQLSKIDGIIQLRLKHFDQNLIGWEEKDEFVTFELIKLEKNKAYFDGLTYELKDINNLAVYLAMKNENEITEVVFNFTRRIDE